MDFCRSMCSVLLYLYMVMWMYWLVSTSSTSKKYFRMKFSSCYCFCCLFFLLFSSCLAHWHKKEFFFHTNQRANAIFSLFRFFLPQITQIKISPISMISNSLHLNNGFFINKLLFFSSIYFALFAVHSENIPDSNLCTRF